MLMRMLVSQPGVTYIDQPLGHTHFNPWHNRLPRPVLNTFVSIRKGEDSRNLQAYFEAILSGRLRVNSQWKLFDPSYSFVVNQLVIKCVNGPPIMDWFMDHLDVKPIFFVRHPVPTALSIMNWKWGNSAEAFLQDEGFCSEWLGAEKERFCRKILSHGSLLEQFVLEICLCNIKALGVARERGVFTLSYEELLMRPKEVSELICEKIGLFMS